jgi:hypothetical protein
MVAKPDIQPYGLADVGNADGERKRSLSDDFSVIR